MTNGTRRGEGSVSRPGRSLPPEKTRYPLYRRLRGPQGRYVQVRKISPQPGFDPRTVQPVASRYIDWATPARSFHVLVPIFLSVTLLQTPRWPFQRRHYPQHTKSPSLASRCRKWTQWTQWTQWTLWTQWTQWTLSVLASPADDITFHT
jgi:hypothetical protein